MIFFALLFYDVTFFCLAMITSWFMAIFLFVVFRVNLKDVKGLMPRINYKISTSKLREKYQVGSPELVSLADVPLMLSSSYWCSFL